MIRDFKGLEVWQKSMELTLDVYIFIEKIPNTEKYALIDQIRRSSISVPSNIAEGHSRQTTKEYIQFLYIASGSISELETQIILVNRLYHIEVYSILEKITAIKMMLNKLSSSLKKRIS